MESEKVKGNYFLFPLHFFNFPLFPDIKMGWAMGFEPTTTGATILRSTNWATPTIKSVKSEKYKVERTPFYFQLFTCYLLIGAPERTRTSNPRLSLPATAFAAFIQSLWSGLSLHHCRCHTYSLYGSLRQVSTGLPSASPVKVSPLQCGSLYKFRFPIEAPLT